MNKDVKHVAFGNQLMLLYGRAKLSQSEFASLVGFSSVAVRKWESGESCPKAESLKRVIEILMSKRAFSEQTEAIQLWELANQRGLKVPFDSVWFREVMQIQSEMAKHVPSEVEHKESVSTPYIGTGFASVQLEQPESSLKECAPRPERETPAPILAPDQGTPVRQNLPFPPNPFFTGRESELVLISHLFEKNERIAITQPISISGLGGIGKTQLALEYAHRCYPGVYHSVFFVNAADKASLEAGYLSLAHLLQLPEKNEREVDHIVQAVKVWLEEHAHWLLILDNADDLELACSFLPTRARGHILFTTRSQIVGNVATLIPVSAMSREEGLLFLLRRSGFLPPGTSGSTIASGIRREAERLVEMLSGHPLALDQAGAYIEETRDPNVSATSAPLCKYRQLYLQQSRHLLKSRGSLGAQHPESVARTIEICVKSACELYPGCADILSFCSLLHPDAIPDELLCQETALDLDLLHFNEAIVALRRYSLVKRDSEKEALSIHRLVQAVIRDAMESQTLRQWMARVMRAVNAAFPEAEFEQWSRCEQLLSHVLVCATWIESEAIAPAEGGHLLRKAGNYLRERGQYSDAEPLHKLALAIHEQYLGAEHPDTAESLHGLAQLCQHQGKHEQAEALYQRALRIREQWLGETHPETEKTRRTYAAFLRRTERDESTKVTETSDKPSAEEACE